MSAHRSCCCGGEGGPAVGVTECPTCVTHCTDTWVTPSVTMTWDALVKCRIQENGENCYLVCDGAGGGYHKKLTFSTSGTRNQPLQVVAQRGGVGDSNCDCWTPPTFEYTQWGPVTGTAQFELAVSGGTPSGSGWVSIGGSKWYRVLSSSGLPSGWSFAIVNFDRCTDDPCGLDSYKRSIFIVQMVGAETKAITFEYNTFASDCADFTFTEDHTLGGSLVNTYSRKLLASDTDGPMAAGHYGVRKSSYAADSCAHTIDPTCIIGTCSSTIEDSC